MTDTHRLSRIHQKGSVASQVCLTHGLSCLWRAIMEACHEVHPKPKSITELKGMLQVIWDNQPQEAINKTVKSVILRLKRYAKAGGGHFMQSDCQTSDKLLTVLSQ